MPPNGLIIAQYYHRTQFTLWVHRGLSRKRRKSTEKKELRQETEGDDEEKLTLQGTAQLIEQ